MHNLEQAKELLQAGIKKFTRLQGKTLQFESKYQFILVAKLSLKFSDICWKKGEFFNSFTKDLSKNSIQYFIEHKCDFRCFSRFCEHGD